MEAELDELFGAPLDDFIRVRKALADKLRKRGRAAQAKEVAALHKPALSAWAVNQLRLQDPKRWERFMALGAEMRQVYAELARGGAVDRRRKLQDELQRMIGGLQQKARRILSQHGHAVAASTLGRVMATLQALALRKPDDAVQAGRLTADVAPPGLEGLLGFGGGAALPAPEAPEAQAEPETQSARPPRSGKPTKKLAKGETNKAAKAARVAQQRQRKLEEKQTEQRRRAQAAVHAAERVLAQRTQSRREADRKVAEALKALRAAEAAQTRAAAQEASASKGAERARLALDKLPRSAGR